MKLTSAVSTGKCGVSVEVERMASKVSMWTRSEGWLDYNTMNGHHIHIDMYDRLSMYTEKHHVGIYQFFFRAESE